MAIKKSEIYSQIWAACDKLRGGVEPARYKDYILTLLFVKYVSDRFKSSDNWDIEVPEGGSFDDVIALKYKKNIGEGINIIIGKLAEANDLKGIIDIADFNSEELGTDKEAVDKLSGLVEIFQKPELDFTNNRAGGDDILGDAYEFLMRKFAQDSGKSKGQFYTPGEVSRIMAKVIGIETAQNRIMTVYDPACGSGSLLLQAAKILGKENVRLGFFGQEINLTTYNLCRINMLLHDIDYDKFDIAHEDTLTHPQHLDDEPFEVIVSNPPYSIKWEGDDNPVLINDPRFSPAGVLAPKSKADLAFIMHSLAWLASNGTAAIVCFPGIMYRGGAEKKIRQYLIDNNFIDCVIQLPSNLFYGTSIATCIMVLKRNKTDNRTLFIDASAECEKVTNNNKLREHHIKKILDAFVSRADTDHFARCVPYEEIANNEYNLSVSTYIQPEDTREVIDITKLNAEIEQIVAREQVLRDEIARIIAEIEG